MALCNLIDLGTLPDGPARNFLLGGKGTALHKPDGGLRPVVTANPLAHYTGHSTNRVLRPDREHLWG